MIKIYNIYNITSFCKRNVKVILKITIKLKQKIVMAKTFLHFNYIFFIEYVFVYCLPITK